MQNNNPVEWLSRAAAPSLPDDEAHIWRLPLSANASDDPNLLPAEERHRIERLPEEQQQSRLALRLAQYRVLAGYAGCGIDGLRIEPAPGGKPRLTHPDCRLQFNLSHSADLALLAVARRPVGIDVERARPISRMRQIAERVFDKPQLAEMLHDNQLDEHRFWRGWTGLEAQQKLSGAGLFGPQTSAACQHLFCPADGCYGALAMEGRSLPKIRYFALQSG